MTQSQRKKKSKAGAAAPETHRDANSAWQWLATKGGIEPEGRDLPLTAMLRDRLNPEALHLEDALSGTSVTAFLNAFFGVISPFVAMMRDLLAYFEAAGATEGPMNWVLALGDDGDELEVDLDAFKRWIAAAERSRPNLRTVPNLDRGDLFEMRTCFYPTRKKDPNLPPGEIDYRQPEPLVKSPELVNWLEAYERGDFLDLPAEASAALADEGPVGDVAALLTEIYFAVRTIARSREGLRHKGNASRARDDFWSAKGLWYFESDLWVRGRLLDIAAYQQATKKEQAQVRQQLSAFFKDRPRRRMRYDMEMGDLEQILSLPAWQKRYELYSAWILTLLLKALDGHVAELEHDNGRISFSFKETLMARIPTAAPPVEIYSERRSELANPVGHGRSHGVQPDYSFWTEDGRCPLAVECKHYKHSSTRNFADALNDYSAALGSARIILANYGPVSPAVEEALEKDRRSRCSALGNVNPGQASEVERFCRDVREAIGKPRPLPGLEGVRPAIRGANARLLVIDVSGSMGEMKNRASGRDFLRDMIARTGVRELATVDDALIAQGWKSELTAMLSKEGSGGTNLGPAVENLLKTYHAVLVLTDAEGARSLSALHSSLLTTLSLSGIGGEVHLLLVNQ